MIYVFLGGNVLMLVFRMFYWDINKIQLNEIYIQWKCNVKIKINKAIKCKSYERRLLNGLSCDGIYIC